MGRRPMQRDATNSRPVRDCRVYLRMGQRPMATSVPALRGRDTNRERMHAMVLKKIGTPLERTELPDREPGPGEIRVQVAACGVCRTDLHVVDGELPDPRLPIIPGHEIVGRVDALGAGVEGLRMGERVGVPWLAHTCGSLPVLRGRAGESLRPAALYRVYARWGICDGDDRRCAVCVSTWGDGRGCGGCAAAVRGADRVAFAGDGGGGEEAGALRFRSGGAYRCASGGVAGAIGIRLHAVGRCRQRRHSRGGLARRGLADRMKCRRSRWMRPSSSRRRAPWCPWR